MTGAFHRQDEAPAAGTTGYHTTMTSALPPRHAVHLRQDDTGTLDHRPREEEKTAMGVEMVHRRREEEEPREGA